MNEELKKALESLIDETINEIEELKKSRFSASEVKLEGPGEDGIKGHKANGHLDKEEDDDKDEDKDDADDAKKADKEEDDKEEKKDDEKPKMKEEKAEKAEGKNREADPNGGHHQMDKGEGKNREADPNGGCHSTDGGAPVVKEEAEKADKMGYGKGMMAKGGEELDTLVKSLFEERFAPLEKKLASILDMVNQIADQPLPRKGVDAKVVPLTKSSEERTEPLSKSEVSSKLFDLKKSGTQVDSLDVTKAELGQDLQAIAKKYNLA